MLKTSLTSVVHVLICSTRAPVTLTPGTVTVTVPLICAASWPARSSTRPVPPVRLTTGVPPAVSVNVTFLATIRTTVAPLEVTLRSKDRSPETVWPATVKPAPSATTCR